MNEREECQNCGCPLEPDFARCPQCGEPLRTGQRRQNPETVAQTRVAGTPPSVALAHVVISAGPGTGNSTQLRPITDIGRISGSNQIVIDDSAVSRRHGRIRYEDQRFVYYDLGSRNGSWLVTPEGNRERVKGAVPLRDGDELEIGGARLLFRETPSRGQTS